MSPSPSTCCCQPTKSNDWPTSSSPAISRSSCCPTESAPSRGLPTRFGNLGVPILAIRGYDSQTHVDEVVRHVDQCPRPAVLLYAGDFDPSGEDTGRDFVERTDCWSEVVHVALTGSRSRYSTCLSPRERPATPGPFPSSNDTA